MSRLQGRVQQYRGAQVEHRLEIVGSRRGGELEEVSVACSDGYGIEGVTIGRAHAGNVGRPPIGGQHLERSRASPV